MDYKSDFKWIDAFRNLAEKLIDMHNKGKEAELAVNLYNAAVKSGLTDKPKKIFENFKESRVFPFTALVYVATQYKEQKSSYFYLHLCDELKPKEIDTGAFFNLPGIPLIQHGWTDFTKASNFDNWEVFEEALKCKHDGVKAFIEKLCNTEDSFNASKSTALFIVNPEVFYSLDSCSRRYLTEKNILVDGDSYSWEKYSNQYDEITSIINTHVGPNVDAKYRNAIFSSNAWYDSNKKSGTNYTQNITSNKTAVDENNTTIGYNKIIYGPPGTGKTYSIKNRVETISGEKYDDLVKSGRLKFVTFHQSYGYEEFVEGIKPSTDETDGNGNIKYSVEPGVFKKFCDENRWIEKSEGSKDYPINDNPKVWKVSLKGTGDNDIRKECLKNDHIRIGWDEYGENITDDMDYSAYGGKNVLNAFINTMRVGDIVLSCYSSTTIDAVGIVKSNYRYDNKFEEYKRVRDVEWLIKYQEERIFELNHRKPLKPPTVYELKISADDVLRFIEKDICTKNSKPCFFIIDEINRGNISKIFGELITLIEESKRDKVSVTLPYSGEEFTVPSNVYVIGTMNTADRSIALLDTALRRRFDFEEMMPNPENLTDDCDGVNLKVLLRVMNERIEYLLDREHTIGHAYFMESDENGEGHSINSLDKLKDIFQKKIIPLLQEYFYDDYEKISLVLGGQFISVKDVPKSLENLGLGKVYEINPPEDITANDFISIYNEDVNNGSNEGTDE